jgi:hypothetical protein
MAQLNCPAHHHPGRPRPALCTLAQGVAADVAGSAALAILPNLPSSDVA